MGVLLASSSCACLQAHANTHACPSQFCAQVEMVPEQRLVYTEAVEKVRAEVSGAASSHLGSSQAISFPFACTLKLSLAPKVLSLPLPLSLDSTPATPTCLQVTAAKAGAKKGDKGTFEGIEKGLEGAAGPRWVCRGHACVPPPPCQGQGVCMWGGWTMLLIGEGASTVGCWMGCWTPSPLSSFCLPACLPSRGGP